MKKRKLTKMSAVLLATALSVATVFSGCNKKVDYDMGDGTQKEESAGEGGELSSRLGVPESYEGKLDVGDSGIKEITIKDDDIITPDSDSMSIVSYKKNSFDNAYRQKVCEAIFDKSKGIYVYDFEHQTKSDLQTQIDSYQTMLDDAKEAGDTDTEDYCKEYISYLENEMATATDEREGAGDYSASDYIGQIGDNQFMLSFSEGTEGLNASFDLSYYPSESMINYRPYEGASFVYAYDAKYGEEGIDDSIVNTCTFSEDEAVSLAQEFLAGCGIDDVIVTDKSPLLWEYYDSSYNVIATEYEGYIVNFGRSVNGTAPYSADLSMVDTLSSDEDDAWYDAPTETFSIQIDSNGVINASCYPLLVSTGEDQKNVDLLSWKELLKELDKNVAQYYTDNKTSYSDIEFNDVRLTYYCIKDDSQDDVYNYVPVWIFAQADENDGTYDFDYPVQALMVNATDGTIYNLKDVLEAGSISYSDYYDDQGDMIDGYEYDDSDMESIDSDGSDDGSGDSSDGSDDGSDDSSDEIEDGSDEGIIDDEGLLEDDVVE